MPAARSVKGMKGLGLTLLFCLAACSSPGNPRSAAPGPGGRPKVYAVNYPLRYFAERIGGPEIEVFFPAPAGEDPAFWSPDHATLRAYQTADLILDNGAGFARWTERAMLPESRLVDTSAAFKSEYLGLPDAAIHSHGGQGPHSHSGVDFNTWLDPLQAKQQALAVLRALTRLVPASSTLFESRSGALQADLEQLDQGLRALGDPGPLLASHPVYQYLARRYGWQLKSLLWEPGEMPGPQEWQRLAEILKAHPARLMLWEEAPRPEVAARLAQEHRLTPLVFQTCANLPSQGDYLAQMNRNLETLKAAFPPALPSPQNRPPGEAAPPLPPK